MKEIETSDMNDERKQALLKRRELQLESLSQTKATWLYHGAICYFHAGLKEKALKLAEEAAWPLSWKSRALELIQKIKEKSA